MLPAGTLSSGMNIVVRQDSLVFAAHMALANQVDSWGIPLMQADDETTARELVEKLQGLDISMSSMKGRRSLGWSHRGSAYCQLIRDVKKNAWSGL